MKLTAVLIGPAILAFLITTGVSHVLPEPRSESQAHATGLSWDGRVFASQGEFARWLAERGRSYREWDRLHPGSPWATTRSTKAASTSGARRFASNADRGSNSVVVAILGGALVLVIGLLAIGVALLVRMKITVDRLTEPSLLASRTAPRTSENGAGSVAAAGPRLAGARLAARRGIEAARPRLESAGLAARRGVEAAGPRLESAGLAARRGVEAAAAETAVVGLSVRYAIATGRLRGALFYAFAAVFSAALGLATAILL